MPYSNNNNSSFFSREQIENIIQENKQLIYGINSFKKNDGQEHFLRLLLSRLQKNLFLLAHLTNQPKAPKCLTVNDLLKPTFSCDYSSENKREILQTISNRAPSIALNSPILSSNTAQPIYFETNNADFRINDQKISDQQNLQSCENPNNISNPQLSKLCYESIAAIPPEFDSQNGVGTSIGNSSSNSNYIQTQNNEHFICRYCQRKCRNQSGLTQHTMKVHPDAPEVQHLLKQAQSRSSPNPLSIINVSSSTY
ncbi:C2H2 finger domain containing [Cryptosporidium sp. chipmunk genotype I]|uniref:C2H2 finger domain containing n=1 Tax=Cryptosporidium sp. chipmunk genotype I TaxID=1280935 RepID=UPI00351A034C|nr:C2H2 finger domain containing [Cryptosporidium sp. chipmunk genotype I]